jgi:hypothetical protein
MPRKIVSGKNSRFMLPDKGYAQIIIETDLQVNTLERAKQIIEELGFHIIDTKNLGSQFFLLKLDTKDMREIALKLSQKGFSKIEGYNASS